MKFKYIAYDKNKKKIKGIIEAVNENEAKELLKDYIIVELKKTKSFNISFSTIKKSELATLLYTISLYLKASIPLINALKLTKNQIQNPKIIKFLDYVIKEIKEGKNFFTALNSQKIIKFPSYVINAIKVGEESGNLGVVLKEMSKFLKEEDKISSKSTQALIYPSFIVLVAFILVGFMLTNIVPKMVNIFNSINQELPPITQFVINTGNFLKSNFLSILFIIFLISVIFTFLYKKNFRFRFIIHSVLLKLPVIKNIIISKELGRFCYLTSTLVSSGVTFVNATNLSSKIIENECIKEKFEKAIKSVLEGKKLSISLKKEGFDFDRSFLEALALAEETSEVEEILKNLSEIYFEENKSRINTLLSMIEPLLIIIVGGAIGIIVTSMILPMVKMNMLK